MTDIVERLRARYMDTKNMLPCELEHEAAKVIEQLRNDIHSCGPTCSRAGCVNGRLRAALTRAGEATAYASHDDSCGYLVCCGAPSYMDHRKDCYLLAALESTK